MADFNPTMVRVGVTGTVYVAPVGTALPTDVSTNLNAAFQSVGFISEEALVESLSITTERLRAWQRPVGIRTLTTEVEWTFQFGMLETSPLALDLYYGLDDGTTVTSGVAKTSISAFPQSVQRAMVIEIEDGDVVTRYALPIVEVGEREEVTHNLSEGTIWGVTVNVMGSSLDDMGFRYTNDPTFVALGS
jgi:hypothetical protein